MEMGFDHRNGFPQTGPAPGIRAMAVFQVIHNHSRSPVSLDNASAQQQNRRRRIHFIRAKRQEPYARSHNNQWIRLGIPSTEMNGDDERRNIGTVSRVDGPAHCCGGHCLFQVFAQTNITGLNSELAGEPGHIPRPGQLPEAV
jgi:hypothetical protein